MTAHTFPKEERLCNKKSIELLYSSPNKLICFPLSVHWNIVDNGSIPCRVQVLIVAPKRRLHFAVMRNRTKRLMRECWRLNKGPLMELLEQTDKSLTVGISYIHNAIPKYSAIEKAMVKALSKLSDQLKNQDVAC